jgi:hypothetical protein
MNEERVADRTATAAYQHAIAEAHSRGDLSDAEADSANRALEIWADDSSEVYLHRLERLLDHYTRLKSRRELAMRVYMELGVDDAMTEALLAERIEKTNWSMYGTTQSIGYAAAGTRHWRQFTPVRRRRTSLLPACSRARSEAHGQARQCRGGNNRTPGCVGGQGSMVDESGWS